MALKFKSLNKRGIILIKFISSPNHLMNQEFEDTATIVPVIVKIKNTIWKFFKNIKKKEIKLLYKGYEPFSLFSLSF